MDIQLLGPLAVTIDGAPVSLGGYKQQALLAFLAVNARQGVSADRCIHAIWGPEPPDGAIRSLQTYVSNLRRELEPGHVKGEPWSVIETLPSGDYRFNVAETATDVNQFEQLIAEAAASRPEDASDLVGRALEMWVGRPLGDLGDEPWAQGLVSHLNELHLEAKSKWIDARLALGEHDLVIGDLAELTDAHPFHERFWAQTMLALYRAGRQAEALRTFGRLRTLLRDELGLDPSPELQNLEERILQHDPSLAAPVRIPNNVPAAISSFVGRVAELEQVDSLLNSCRVLTITGAPGAGKTRLAYEVAESVLEDYPDGVWIIELAPLRNGDLIVAELLSALRLDAPVVKTPLDALCDQVSDWNALFVADNCEHLLAETTAILHALLRSAPGLKVLATSRHALDMTGEVAWRLPPLETPADDVTDLTATDSTRLFCARAEAAQPGIDLTVDAATVAGICRELDGLPLAIELAATRLRSITLEELAERLRDRFRFLSRGDPSDIAHHRTLQAMVDWSYDLLDIEEQEAYRRLAAFRDGWDIAAAESVCASKNIDSDRVFEAVDSLHTNSLVVRELHGEHRRFRMLETMRQHASALLRDTGEIEDAWATHLAWVLALATEAGASLDGAEQQRWLAKLNAELDNMRAAFGRALEGGDVVTALDAASRIPRYWWLTSQIAEGADWLERLLVASSEAPPDIRARGLSASGFLINMLGRPDDAVVRLREAVQILRDVGDEVALAWALNFLGRAAWDTDDWTALRSYQREATELFTKHGLGQGVFLGLIMETAVVAFYAQDRPTALAMAEQAVAIAERVGAPNALAHAYESRAWTSWTQDTAPAALENYRLALPYYRTLGNRDCAAHCLAGVAHSLILRGDVTEAAELMGAVDALLESLSVVPPGYERVLYSRAEEALAGAEAEARRLGRTLDFDRAIDRAIELVS